ncbi:peroxidase-like [Diabrotica virgifera virgifera]|uniref:Peroxidase-like n=1 Tax=Diabrotica virgifera virgifera TaxID=50390 RepID=A0A6P7GPL1_DIAVI|nr:peroxidase-like [Diabrotica virgifera virgifera]
MALTIIASFLVQLVFSSVSALHPSYNIFLQQPSLTNTIQNIPVSYHSSGVSGGNSYFGNFVRPTFPAQPTPDPSTLGCGTPPASCPNTRYRSYDGSCNNLRNPILGTPNTPYTRLLPQNYGDGISNPSTAKSGNDLPLSRLVSLVLYPDVPKEDPIWTLNAMQYGQIITHDMSMILGSTQAQPHGTRCCSSDGQLLELANIPDHCYPIVLPDKDPQHSQTNTRCMNFVRTITDLDRNCVGRNQPAEQLTAVNHYLDLSIVYGNNDQVNQQVRQFQAGRLRVDVRNGQEWPPRSLNASGICTTQNPNEACYLAGDARVNQNPQLTLLQIVLLREHNRIAGILAKLNPHWDDETLFQESRIINVAQHQQITYYEWLPIFIGEQNSLKNNILYNTKDFVNDYDENVNPTILNEHATAAFRYFHSLIAGSLDLVTEERTSYGSLRLSDWFNRPQILEEGNNFDELARGLNTQPELAADQYHTSEITQFLFRAGQPFGQDLKSFDIQRNRDHGLATYNDYRQFCGLTRAHTFEGFLDVISEQNVQKLSTLYESPDDVDLTVGGSLEAHVPGTLAGPTFLCILTEQFYRTRKGDRFFFENVASGLNVAQLNEIRKASISRLLCDNAYSVQAMQPRGFQRISQSNPVVPCDTLPSVDLSLWKDFGAGVHQTAPLSPVGLNSHLIYRK